MTVLLVNDDGWESDGLQSLRTGLLKAGIRVITVAPDAPRSGMARSATFRRPVRVEHVQGDEANPVYACTGTPVDCVRIALLSHLAEPVQLVISGINEGANLGDDATYSSTTGAAIEGALLGLPAFAISQQAEDHRFRLVDRAGYDWSGSVALALALAGEFMQQPPPPRAVFNVNCPGRPSDRPVLITRLGQRAWRRGGLVEEHTEAYGVGYYSFGVNDDADPPIHDEDSTDFAALKSHHPSITPFSFQWGTPGALREATAWLERVLKRVNDVFSAPTPSGGSS